MDITKDPLPKADFVMIRDVLFHLSNQDIVRVLQNFVTSGSEWLATSHAFQVTEMIDVPSDPTTFRPVNLMTAPFHFAPPDYAEGLRARLHPSLDGRVEPLVDRGAVRPLGLFVGPPFVLHR